MKTIIRTIWGKLVPLLAIAGWLVTASASDARFVLRIVDHDGTTLIPGEAPDPYAGWIRVYGFGAGAEIPKSGGPVLGSVAVQGTFTFHKRFDKATPFLQRALLNGQVFPAVWIKRLVFMPDAVADLEPILVDLRHVRIVSYRIHAELPDDSTSSVPTEEITLQFSEARYVYREYDRTGGLLGSIAALLTDFLGTEDPAFDDDQDGIPNDLDNDDDNDGIPDNAELRGGSNPFVDDADEDPDRDGQANWEEAIAGTRMDDGSDYFGIASITHRQLTHGLQLTISLPVMPGRAYRLLGSTSLSLPKDAWVVLHDFEVPAGSSPAVVDLELNSAILRNPQRLFLCGEVRLIGN